MPAITRKTSTKNRDLGLERLVFFSDAVIAIAITLLAIDLKLPEVTTGISQGGLKDQLQNLTPRIISYVISFTVIGIYWVAHHRYFRYIRHFDDRLIILNFVFLFFIASMPFFAGLLGQFALEPLAVMAYAGAVSGLGFSTAAIWWYATSGRRLVESELEDGFIRIRRRIALVIPFFFLVSMPFAYIHPFVTIGIWWFSPLAAYAIKRAERANHAVK